MNRNILLFSRKEDKNSTVLKEIFHDKVSGLRSDEAGDKEEKKSADRGKLIIAGEECQSDAASGDRIGRNAF